MNKKLGWWLSLVASMAVHPCFATTPWSAQDYDLYSGDFDGDGQADVLYIAKDPSKLSGIARGVSGGFDSSFQSWPSNFLGVPWSGNQYNVIILQNTKSTGIPNKQADILLQSKSTGGNSFLLQPNAQGRIMAISQPLGNNGGQAWSADQHRIVAGDFNGDGLADVFLQAASPAGTNAVMLADGNGQFTAGAADQTWSDGFLGFKWATTEAIIYSGDFNADGYADLFIQARPKWVMINYDVAFPVPTYLPNMNGIAFAHSSGSRFSTAAAPGEALGYYAWSRTAFGVDWSPLVTTLQLGRFSGSAYTDILVQALRSNRTSYLVTATGTNAVFANGSALASNVSWSADTVRLVAGNYGGLSTTGVYCQALSSTGTNSFATSITGSTVSTTAHDPTAPPPGTAPTAPGRTPGVFSVSNAGAATYSIPIWSPPGVGAVQLKLALNYSSRSPDGVMGMGWGLSGLSAITRCNRTWEQDGAPQGVTLTSSDRFCLDGQQLKLVSGTPEVGGSIYATEIESFSQVAANGSSSGPPISFTVTTKNGLIYDYGLATDSQILAGPSGPVRAWALSQIRDRVGNTIKLSYYNDAMSGTGYTNGSYRIKEIDYPYTASNQGPFYSLTFTYGGRASGTSFYSGYLAGNHVQEPNQLNSISIQNYGSSTPTKVYNLSYATNAVTSRLQLNQVQECSASACFPATSISYQNGAQGWSSAAQLTGVSLSSSTVPSPIPVDLNGDGLTDLLYPVPASTTTSHWWVAFATGSGYGSPVDTAIVANNSPEFITGAFTGGANQFLAPQNGYWVLVQYNGSSFTTSPTNIPLNGEMFAADYDGDGLPDLVSAAANAVLVRRNTTTAGGAVSFATAATPVWSATATLAANNTGIFTSADFNGDGRADILATTIIDTGFSGGPITYWNVLLSNGFGTAPTVVQLRGSGQSFPGLGDWNGDGCTDIVSTFNIFISNCAGGFTTIASNGPSVADTGIPIDWDGDGRADLIYNHSNTWYVLRSTGDGAATAAPIGIAAPTSTSWFPLDQNGDGLVDLAYVDGNNGFAIKFLAHNGAASPADLATSFTDGFGIGQSLTYTPISQNNYTKCTGATANCPLATYPEQDYQGSLYVVNQFSASDGTGSTYQDQFWYYGARVHAQGRGFEGFYARRTNDSRNYEASTQSRLYSYEYLAQRFPYTGMLVQRLVSTSGSVSLGSPSGNVSLWTGAPTAQQLLASGQNAYETRNFPFLQTSTEKQYEYGALGNGLITTTVKQFTYGDGYGNPTNVQTTITDNDPASPFPNQTWQTTVVSTFLNDNATSAWCLGLPTQTTVTSSVPGQTPQIRTYGFTPDPSHLYCREQQRSIEPNTAALNVTETLTYDSCGNIGQVDVVGHNADGTAMSTRSTQYNYAYFTPRCQFPEKVTNALSQASTISYQYDFGVPVTATDPNGIAVTWRYDDFGRRTQETRPDKTSTAWSFKYCVNAPCWGTPDLRFVAIQNEYDANGVNYFSRDLFYDGLQRMRYDESNRVLGTWTVNDAKFYDSLGHVISDYVPYTTSSNGNWKYGFDLLGRRTSAQLLQASGALDRTTSWSYAGRSVQVTDPLSHIKKYVNDVTGRLRQVTDPLPGNGSSLGRTISYEYDDFGNLSQITDAIGAVWKAFYNLRGFRYQVVDPDAGTWNFQADSLNEVTSWRDAKNQPFTVQYDPLGRMTQRIEPAGTSTWTWGTSAAAYEIGSLSSVSGYGYSENLYFDSAGRLVTRKITTDQPQPYQYDYAYNSIGALDTVTYPTSAAPTGTTAARFKIQYDYRYGFPNHISDVTQSAPTTLWTLSAANDYSSPTNETLGGNAVSIGSTYTPWTNDLTSIQSGVGGSGNNRQNLSYQWDSAGNLTQRKDSIQGLTEVFGYDALNRLTSSTLNTAPTFSATYTDVNGNDRAGNVMSRSDVGSYAYADTSHPHGVTTAGGYAYSYDANGNVISRNGLTLSWASFSLPISLQATVGTSTYSSQFSYGPDHQRYQQSATYSNGTEVTSYAGGLFEKVTGTAMSGITTFRHYVPTPSGLTVIVARNSDGSTTSTYALSDHLGSSDALIDGTAGNVGTPLVQESFGAFGQRRASNWAAGSPSATDWGAIAKATRRGFTFHEELDNIGLVHMNGRVYDPNVGRFLSADPVIGNLADSQQVNPYAYVGNRPLSSVDPTGLFGAITTEAGAFAAPVCGWCGYVVGGIFDLAISAFFGWGDDNRPPPPPPAFALPGVSAQGPVAPCGAGNASAICSSPGPGNWSTNPQIPGVPSGWIMALGAGGVEGPSAQYPVDAEIKAWLARLFTVAINTANTPTTAVFCGQECAKSWMGDKSSRIAPHENTATLGERVLNTATAIPAFPEGKVVEETMMAARGATTVIGRTKALGNLAKGERSLLDRLTPDLGSAKVNWARNSGVIREEMRRGLPIRDASPGDTAGTFLNAERALLKDRGWTFDPATNYWMPPVP